ncbi:hypothetical protein E2C01_025524 [Portunus trituberculatus]|uniref:Uncharacterized protein n=1 Tax=Portunus trituberculatus TaxID=210409 RepID=A0A5B7EFH6_PORTR|nr:hypothetical protein [Portunus trituberculatus]
MVYADLPDDVYHPSLDALEVKCLCAAIRNAVSFQCQALMLMYTAANATQASNNTYTITFAGILVFRRQQLALQEPSPAAHTLQTALSRRQGYNGINLSLLWSGT